MLVFRPVRFSDLPAVEHLAISAGNSMTTLPNNRDHLEQLINNSSQSLRRPNAVPSKESYHFVIENLETQEVLGISGIEACVGYNSPFYNYKCEQLVHSSDELQIENTIDTLSLSQDYEGASRLYTLFLAPSINHIENRQTALSLLSLARLMFIGQQPLRFKQKFVLELQGLINEQQESPFWKALGQHFFNMDFYRANYLTGINAKGFIADLMPQHPVYVPLLAQSAQQAIAQLRPDLTDVLQLLTSEGFEQRGYISIFDGGPALECATSELKTVRQQRQARAQIVNSSSAAPEADALSTVIISNNSAEHFCATIARQNLTQLEATHSVQITAEQAQALNIADGDKVFILTLTDVSY